MTLLRAGAARAAWLGALLVPIAASAQAPDTTLRHYDLSEVVVEEGAGPRAPVATVQRIGVAQMARIAPAVAADVMRLVPGAHLQVNSRGEALVYLRGAPERQVALFLDGIPLNVPWDARFDLSLLPASLLGSVEAAKGPFSVLYGPNSTGGVIELRTKTLSAPGRLVEAELSGGLPLRTGGSVAAHHHTERFRLDAGAAAHGQRGDALPGTAHLPFSQGSGGLRANTDRRQAGLVVRAGTSPSERSRLSATVALAEAEKGIAPESHLDPDRESVRFWRYPLLRLGVVSVSAERESRAGTLVRAQAWSSLYAQHIDQYDGAAYERITATQRDGDYTHGLRLSTRAGTGATRIRSVLLLSTSLHRQRDGALGDTGTIQRYQQHMGSAALDASHRLRGVTLRAGMGIETQATPLTGDKPAYGPQLAWSGAAGASWRLGETLDLRAGASRKVRFPTPRELFGTALKRFLLNPDLKPEKAWSAEVGGTWERPAYRLDAVAFANWTADAIDQRSVVVDGRSLRQRVNLAGSHVRGVEFSGAWRPAPALRFEGHMTALRARGREDGLSVPLAEKPALMALLLGEAHLPGGIRASLDVNRIADAFAAERDGVRRRLPGAWLVGTQLSRILRAGRSAVTVFARVDNALDAAYLPQEGLPLAGRTLIGGVRVRG